ncbi:MAG TPA: CoA transferase [Candidatus Binataceae bacterium]|nr:CoA transferase [Candidatus Binataceae bacterium]
MSAQRPTRVLDLSVEPAGGYATRLLAMYGTEVIKVESPDGDPARRRGPFPKDTPNPECSALALFLDMNKKSITLNIRDARGRALLDRLLESSDVILESFAPSEAEHLGLVYAEMERRFPRLVLVSVTPFGKDGPYRDLESCPLVLEAMSGWLFQSGERGREPTRTRGEMLAAMVPGLFAATGILAALRWREQTGEGQLVEVSAMEAMLAASRYFETTFAYRGTVLGSSSTTFFRYRRTRDGWVAPAAATDSQRELLAHAMGLSEHLGDPAFKAPKQGEKPLTSELFRLLDQWYADHSKVETFELLQSMRIPCGYVADSKEVLSSEQLRKRGAFTRVAHPVAGAFEYPGTPFPMSAAAYSARRAPLLGEHNHEIFRGELGLDADELDRLHSAGVI